MDYHILRVEKIELLLFLIFSFPDSKKLEIFFFYYEMKWVIPNIQPRSILAKKT